MTVVRDTLKAYAAKGDSASNDRSGVRVGTAGTAAMIPKESDCPPPATLLDDEPSMWVGISIVVACGVCSWLLWVIGPVSRYAGAAMTEQSEPAQISSPAPHLGLPRVRITDPARIHDGDTLTQVEIQFPWGVSLRGQSIRASDFDAPEISRIRRTVTITDEELQRGRAARDYLAALITDCDLYVIPDREERDGYGRVLARWYLRDSSGRLVSIADLMREHNHIRQ